MKNSIVIFICAVCLVAGLTTKISAQGGTKEIVIGKLVAYKHPSKWFSMKVPEKWKITDESGDDDAINIDIRDPSGIAGFSVGVSEEDSQLSSDELIDILNTFLTENLSTQKKYKQYAAKEMGDGRISVYLTYAVEASGVSYPMLGNSFIQQKGKLLAVLTFIIPRGEYKRNAEQLDEIINSLTLN